MSTTISHKWRQWPQYDANDDNDANDAHRLGDADGPASGVKSGDDALVGVVDLHHGLGVPDVQAGKKMEIGKFCQIQLGLFFDSILSQF